MSNAQLPVAGFHTESSGAGGVFFVAVGLGLLAEFGVVLDELDDVELRDVGLEELELLDDVGDDLEVDDGAAALLDADAFGADADEAASSAEFPPQAVSASVRTATGAVRVFFIRTPHKKSDEGRWRGLENHEFGCPANR